MATERLPAVKNPEAARSDYLFLGPLLHNLSEPVLWVDRERVVRYVNQAATAYLGHTAAGGLIRQRPLGALGGAPWVASLDALCAAVLASGHALARTELPFTDATRNGEAPRFFDVEAEPTRDGAEHLNGVALVLRDVTERVLLREAHQAAQEKARLLARALQSDILARGDLGPIPGYSLAVSYRPMDTEHGLGGDFFDGFPLGLDSIGLVLGDACGKGLGAVLDTAVVKFFLKAYARDARWPADVLAKAHRACREEEQFQNFATVFYGLLDTQSHTLVWASAAHEPQLLVRRDGSVQELQPSGVPLGLALVEEPGYEQRAMPLHPGDLLLLFTDGVAEARSPSGEPWGMKRLKALTRERSKTSPREMVECIEQEVDRFTGGRQTDDCTVLALKRDTD